MFRYFVAQTAPTTDKMPAETGTDIERAALLLKAGKLVAIPTETVYGLAADGLNEQAVLSIFKAKNRPDFDPLILHVSGREAAFSLAEYVPVKARLLADAFWPGPLTLVLPKKAHVPFVVTSGLDTVGLRVPNHPLTLSLLKQLDFPLAAPSANPFGYVSPTTAQHVLDNLGDKTDYILDGGPCTLGIESTIIGFENDEPVLLRKGSLKKSDIEKITGPLKEKINVSGNPKAPGQLAAHYSPKRKIVITEPENIGLLQTLPRPVTLLTFGNLFHAWENRVDRVLNLSSEGNLAEAARTFYGLLREADQGPESLIVTGYLPAGEMAEVINDRLQRAAFPFKNTSHE